MSFDTNMNLGGFHIYLRQCIGDTLQRYQSLSQMNFTKYHLMSSDVNAYNIKRAVLSVSLFCHFLYYFVIKQIFLTKSCFL